MSANTNPIFILTALNTTANTQIGNTIAEADGQTAKTVITGATNGTLVYDLIAATDEAAERELTIYLNDGVADWPIGTVEVGIAATSVSLLNIADIPSLNKRDDGAILLAAAQSLKVKSLTDVTAGDTIWITAIGGNM